MSNTFSVIGSDITIKGDVSATADLHIDGRVEGDIQCSSLVQGESSTIQGKISAESARLAGVVNGSISARELVVLKTARIEGDVHYEALTVEQGAVVEGHFGTRKKPAAPVAREPKKVAFPAGEQLAQPQEENGLNRLPLSN